MDFKEQIDSFMKKIFVSIGINIVLYCIMFYIFGFNYVFANFLAWVITNIFLTLDMYINNEGRSNINILSTLFVLLMGSIISISISTLMLIYFVSSIGMDPVASKMTSTVIVIIFKILLPG